VGKVWLTRVTRAITITAGEPTVTLDPLPGSVGVGDTVVFSGRILKPDGSPVVGGFVTIWVADRYRWLNNPDGGLLYVRSDGEGRYSAPWVVWNQDGVLLGTHTFQSFENNYEVWSGAQSMTITVPLVAAFSADRASGPVPLAVTFSCGASGGVLNYTWSLDPGDGSAPYGGTRTAEGTWTQTHTYNVRGVYTATLTVTDALGTTTSSMVQVGAGVPTVDYSLLVFTGSVVFLLVLGGVAAYRGLL
jgi:hypothetical protein